MVVSSLHFFFFLDFSLFLISFRISEFLDRWSELLAGIDLEQCLTIVSSFQQSPPTCEEDMIAFEQSIIAIKYPFLMFLRTFAYRDLYVSVFRMEIFLLLTYAEFDAIVSLF